MSESVEVVQRVLELWRRGEDPLEAGLIAEDVAYVNPHDAVDTGTRRGHEGWRAANRNFGGAFEIVELHVESVEEVGGRVLVLLGMETRGRGSGLVATRPLGYVFDIRDGQVARFEWHNGWDGARASVGSA